MLILEESVVAKLDYNLIISYINQRSIKVNALAKFAGMTPDGFARSLKNEKLTVATLEKIAHFLELHPGAFFDPPAGTNEELLIENEKLKLAYSHLQTVLKNKEEIIALLKRQIK